MSRCPDPALQPAPRLALILLWVTPAVWSSNYLIARAASGVVAPHVLALGRWTLALLGVLFVIAKGDVGNLLAVRFTPGDGWIVLAMLSWVAYSVLQQHWPSALGPRQRLACITAGGVLVLIPFTLLEAALTPAMAFSPKAALLIVLAAVLPGVLSYQAYAYLIRELGATRSSLLLYLAPLYGALNAWWLLGEVPQWYHGVGALMILPSIALATRRG